MTDRTTADEIAAIFQEAAEVFIEHFHADTYVILRTSRPDSGDGAWASEVVSEVESGRCALLDGMASSRPSVSEVWVTLSPYTVELPRQTGITVHDRIRINGRVYQVDDVRRGSAMETFVTAALTEVQT